MGGRSAWLLDYRSEQPGDGLDGSCFSEGEEEGKPRISFGLCFPYRPWLPFRALSSLQNGIMSVPMSPSLRNGNVVGLKVLASEIYAISPSEGSM